MYFLFFNFNQDLWSQSLSLVYPHHCKASQMLNYHLIKMYLCSLVISHWCFCIFFLYFSSLSTPPMIQAQPWGQRVIYSFVIWSPSYKISLLQALPFEGRHILWDKLNAFFSTTLLGEDQLLIPVKMRVMDHMSGH